MTSKGLTDHFCVEVSKIGKPMRNSLVSEKTSKMEY